MLSALRNDNATVLIVLFLAQDIGGLEIRHLTMFTTTIDHNFQAGVIFVKNECRREIG